MRNTEKYIIITACDLVERDHHIGKSGKNSETTIFVAESDCACPTDDFIFMPDSQKTQQMPLFESNCACPTDGFALETHASNPADANLFTQPSLHMDRLSKDFSLAFNPLGQDRVVVLNQRAVSLLEAFRQAKTLNKGVVSIDDSLEALSAARRLAELNLLQQVGSQTQLKKSAPKTLTAWLHVTNECNLRCPYCYVNKTADDMEDELGKQAVDAIFRSALANSFERVKLKYAGGEATLNFHTVLLLHDHARQLADRHKLEVDGVVLSNGVALSGQMISEMKSRDIHLMISLDGVEEFHDLQRPFINGRGSFSHVERALDRLSAHNFLPSISITVSSRNLNGLAKVIDYVLKRELPFTINFYRENECSVSFTDLKYRDDTIISAMKEAFAVIEADIPPYSLLGAIVDLARLDSPHDRPCGVGNSYLVINHKGGIAKCHMELEQSITDISVPDPLQMIRVDQIGVQNPPVEEKECCRDCHWRYWCAGGCPALTYRTTGRYDIKSPNCRIYKSIFPDVLRLEGLRLLKYCGVKTA
jgi:uncharacterized protein